MPDTTTTEPATTTAVEPRRPRRVVGRHRARPSQDWVQVAAIVVAVLVAVAGSVATVIALALVGR